MKVAGKSVVVTGKSVVVTGKSVVVTGKSVVVTGGASGIGRAMRATCCRRSPRRR
jgi:hypothetical protein